LDAVLPIFIGPLGLTLLEKNLQKKIKRASSSDISGRWSEGFLWGLVNGKIEEKLTRVSQLG
jgi:hypothetical protein